MRLTRRVLMPAWTAAAAAVLLTAATADDGAQQREDDLSGYHLSEYDGSSAAAATGNGVDHGSALYHNPYYQGPFNYYTHRQGVAQNLATLGNAILLGTLASGALAVGEAFLYSTASTNSASVTTNSANAATNLATANTACNGFNAIGSVTPATVTLLDSANMLNVATAINSIITAAAANSC